MRSFLINSLTPFLKAGGERVCVLCPLMDED